MNTVLRTVWGILFLCLVVSAQQSNTPNASLVFNNQAGTGTAIIANIDSPGTLFARIEGEPGRPYGLIQGNYSPSFANFSGIGRLDLSPTSLLINGLDPAGGLDLFAKTRADSGDAFLAATVLPGATGMGPAFQVFIVDSVSPFGLTLTAATRLNFQSVGPAPLIATAGTAPPSPVISASGMAGSSGDLLREVRAPIEAISPTSVTVLGGLVIETDASTSVRGLNGNTISFSSLLVNDYVKVEFLLDAMTMAPIAHQIRRETPRPDFDVKVAAPIDAITLTDITLLGTLFTITAQTDVDVDGGLASLVVGDTVEVKANQVIGGGYEAVDIDDENLALGAFNPAYRTRSFVDSVSLTDSTITVMGITINVGSGVRFDDVSGLSALGMSSYVEVRFNPDASGDYWASRIKLRNADSESRIEGPVGNITATTFDIANVTVQVTGLTDFQNGLTGIQDITNGIRIEAKGAFNMGTLAADEVELDPLDD